MSRRIAIRLIVSTQVKQNDRKNGQQSSGKFLRCIFVTTNAFFLSYCQESDKYFTMADAPVQGGTTEARVRYLEQISQQLNQQMRVMKQLVATEVADLKGVMQQQIAEIKQIVMHQDRVYQERIHRLEARVEQLSEFAMQVARSSGTVASSNLLPMDIVVAGGEGGGDAASPGRQFDEGGDDDDDDAVKGVPGIIVKYKGRIEDIYDFYTHSNINVFHPTMSLPQFTKLLKDCKLAGFAVGEPAELLWMSVLRKMNAQLPKSVKKQIAASRGPNITGVRTGKYPATKKDNFAFERFEEIPREAFGNALAFLAAELRGRNHPDMAPESIFETFLVCDVLPHVEPAIAMRKVQPAMQPRSIVGAASIQEYQVSEPVQGIMNDYMNRIRDGCRDAVRAVQDFRDKTMDLDGFVEFARRHELLPMISKPELREIFEVCANMDSLKKEGVKPGTLSRAAVLACLYHLADRIYGNSLFVDKYPTPQARVQKLMSKMFLLKPKEPITDSWKKP